MADEVTKNGEGTGLNRRNFLKSAGVVVAGGTLGAGLMPAPRGSGSRGRTHNTHQFPMSRSTARISIPSPRLKSILPRRIPAPSSRLPPNSRSTGRITKS